MEENTYSHTVEQDLIIAIYEKLGNWRSVARCIEICSGLRLSASLWLGLSRGSKRFTNDTKNAVRSCFPGHLGVMPNPVELIEMYGLRNAVVVSDDPDTALLIHTGGRKASHAHVRALSDDRNNRMVIELELFYDSDSNSDSPIVLHLTYTGKKCAYCGAAAPLTIDHVIPKSHGGSNDKHNLVWCCHKCNSRKMARTPYEADMPILYPEESRID